MTICKLWPAEILPCLTFIAGLWLCSKCEYQRAQKKPEERYGNTNYNAKYTSLGQLLFAALLGMPVPRNLTRMICGALTLLCADVMEDQALAEDSQAKVLWQQRTRQRNESLLRDA